MCCKFLGLRPETGLWGLGGSVTEKTELEGSCCSPASAVRCTSPPTLHFTSLPYLSFRYLQMSSEGMSDAARLYFLLLLLALPAPGL